MDETRKNTSVKILIGIGLVLVGLAAGILGMMVTDARPSGSADPTRVVERVQLGSAEPASEIPVPDTVRRILEPRTLNAIFRKVADSVTPAVVYIEVEIPLSRDMDREWYHNFDQESPRRFFQDDPLRQTVGSGVVISPQGYIATNYHVVEKAERISVTLSDKRSFDARIVGTDPATDLAVLKIEDEADLPVVRLGNSDEIQVGEWVLAVGNPFRLTSTVTAGIVSATGRSVGIISDTFGIEDFIQTDAAINPGNSGGAVVNLDGQLVGIATAIATESGSYEGYGFAVPVNLVERVVGDIIEYGEVRRGYLGVAIQNVDARVARRLGMDGIMGVYVNEVTAGGSADLAGLQEGDVVLAIDDRAVNAPNQLQSTIARRRPGETLAVRVWRDGRIREYDVELQSRNSPAYERWFSELEREEPPVIEPEPTPRNNNSVFELSEWGIGIRNLSGREHNAFGVRGGVYVAYVENGSLAAAAGLPRDVAVVEIAGRAVESTDQAVNALEEAAHNEESVLLKVRRRDGSSAFYELAVPAPAG